MQHGLAFYEIAAQVIPVLVLVLLIELPLRKLWPYLPRHLRLMALGSFVFCGAGEWRALRVVQTEHALAA
jgi:hypothetical protein